MPVTVTKSTIFGDNQFFSVDSYVELPLVGVLELLLHYSFSLLVATKNKKTAD